MKIAVACKVLFDDQDVQALPTGELDTSKARRIINSYDLNAIEAALELRSSIEGCALSAVCVGESEVDDSKVKKDILSRGADDLYMIADDELAGADAHKTAAALAALMGKMGDWDLLVCGDGSADWYAQQVDAQVAGLLDVPFANAVTKIEWDGERFVAERAADGRTQVVELEPPCVISVVPDIAKPHICGMKDILKAGKKPSTVMSCAEAGAAASAGVEVTASLLPVEVERKHEIYRAEDQGAIEGFVKAVVDVLG